MIRQILLGLVVVSALCLFAPGKPHATAQSDAGMNLLTGIGYQNVGEGPYVLMGAELTQRSRDFGVAVHLSNVLMPNHGVSTVTLGAEGDWSRVNLPFYLVELNAQAYLRQQHDQLAQNMSLRGRGLFGNLQGNLALGYVGRRFASFPWDRDDLSSVIPEDQPYYYFEGGVTAAVLPSIGLRWSQDVAWQQYRDANISSMSFATGPNARLGNGRISLQSGIVIGPDGMVPLTRLSYRIDSLDSIESSGQLHLAIDTTSLSGGGAVLHGAYTLDADWWRVQALLRLEQDNLRNPKLYFSIQPRF